MLTKKRLHDGNKGKSWSGAFPAIPDDVCEKSGQLRQYVPVEYLLPSCDIRGKPPWCLSGQRAWLKRFGHGNSDLAITSLEFARCFLWRPSGFRQSTRCQKFELVSTKGDVFLPDLSNGSHTVFLTGDCLGRPRSVFRAFD